MFSYAGHLKYASGGVCFISGLYHKQNEICSVQMHKNTFVQQMYKNSFEHFPKTFSCITSTLIPYEHFLTLKYENFPVMQ